MWIRRSNILAPLATLMSKKPNGNRQSNTNRHLTLSKRIASQEILLRHPDFNEPFEIHTDASKS